MKMIVRNPTQGIYPASSDYVHAMEVQEPKRFLFVAGTMGLDAQGVAGKTLGEQPDLIWSNIRTIPRQRGHVGRQHRAPDFLPARSRLCRGECQGARQGVERPGDSDHWHRGADSL